MRRRTKNSGRTRGNRGSVLIEAVIASAIALTVLMGAIMTFSYLYRAAVNSTKTIQAAFLAEEGIEIVRLLRDSGWTAYIAPLATSTDVYVLFDGTKWVSTSTSVFIDQEFERTVVFADVYRDTNKNIVTSGGTLDTNIRKVTASVSWSARGATSTRSFSTYLTNVFKN